MNCPTCAKPLVVGTVTDGESRTTYHFCPNCCAGESRRLKLHATGELSAVATLPDGTDEERVTELLRVLPADSRMRLLAWSALQAWHSKALAVIARSSPGPEVAAELRRLRGNLLAELKELTGKEGDK